MWRSRVNPLASTRLDEAFQRSGSGSSTYRRKLVEPPKFTGSFNPNAGKHHVTAAQYDFEVNHHVTLYAKALQDNDISQREFVMMLGAQLEGEAKAWYRLMCESEYKTGAVNPALMNVSSWLAAVHEKFSDPNLEAATRQKLSQLTMASCKGGLREYNRTINECLMILGRLEERDAEDNKHGYLCGLRPDYRKECARLPNLRTTTLAELQQMLERLEMADYDAGFYNSRQSYRTPGSGPTPMELGLTWMNQGDERGGRGGRNGGRGGQRGGRGGGNGRGDGGKAPTPEQALRIKRREERLCYECGSPDHQKRDCPKLSGNEKGAQK
jgi:hypothetical protein